MTGLLAFPVGVEVAFSAARADKAATGPQVLLDRVFLNELSPVGMHHLGERGAMRGARLLENYGASQRLGARAGLGVHAITNKGRLVDGIGVSVRAGPLVPARSGRGARGQREFVHTQVLRMLLLLGLLHFIMVLPVYPCPVRRAWLADY